MSSSTHIYKIMQTKIHLIFRNITKRSKSLTFTKITLKQSPMLSSIGARKPNIPDSTWAFGHLTNNIYTIDVDEHVRLCELYMQI